MTLIGLGGAARAGKNAFAETLERDYGYVTLNMSDPLRAALEMLDPYVVLDRPVRTKDGATLGAQTMRFRTLLHLVGYSAAKEVPEVRRLLQVLGTDVVRKMVDEEAWVNATKRQILEHYRCGVTSGTEARIVVTGIRFDNELEMITDLGGVNAYVARRTAIASAPGHSSEISVLVGDFDYRVDNNGTLAALEQHAHDLMRVLQVAPLVRIDSLNVATMSYYQP